MKAKKIKKIVKKKKKVYFGKEAHEAIVDFQKADCYDDKNKIYFNKIKPSFEKLVENLIFIHGFSKDETHFKTLKCDCVSFLFEILSKFDPDKGSKAFSYFNVCAKNFLIINSKKLSKQKKKNVSLYDPDLSNLQKAKIANHQVIPSQEKILVHQEDKKIIFDFIENIKLKTSNKNEKKCLEAIDHIFKNIENLDYLNKRAIFVYLRELSGLNAKQVSIAMSNIRKNYKSLKKESNGYYFLFSDED